MSLWWTVRKAWNGQNHREVIAVGNRSCRVDPAYIRSPACPCRRRALPCPISSGGSSMALSGVSLPPPRLRVAGCARRCRVCRAADGPHSARRRGRHAGPAARHMAVHCGRSARGRRGGEVARGVSTTAGGRRRGALMVCCWFVFCCSRRAGRRALCCCRRRRRRARCHCHAISPAASPRACRVVVIHGRRRQRGPLWEALGLRRWRSWPPGSSGDSGRL